MFVFIFVIQTLLTPLDESYIFDQKNHVNRTIGLQSLETDFLNENLLVACKFTLRIEIRHDQCEFSRRVILDSADCPNPAVTLFSSCEHCQQIFRHFYGISRSGSALVIWGNSLNYLRQYNRVYLFIGRLTLRETFKLYLLAQRCEVILRLKP